MHSFEDFNFHGMIFCFNVLQTEHIMCVSRYMHFGTQKFKAFLIQLYSDTYLNFVSFSKNVWIVHFVDFSCSELFTNIFSYWDFDQNILNQTHQSHSSQQRHS